MTGSVDEQVGASQASSTITEDEKEVYDRQIRLWGLEAQNRLRNSTVLIAGLSGCGGEVAKNLVLAGLKSLTLLDSHNVSADDYYSQFLLSPDSEGENRAAASRQRCQVLNPNVELRVDTEDVAEKDRKFFSAFDLVILIDQKYSVVDQISKTCRSLGKPFISSGVFGWLGYAFFDFTNCSFLVAVPKVSSGCTLDDDDIETIVVPKKARIETSLNISEKNSGGDLPENIILVDEDEEREMTFRFAHWDEVWNVPWSHKKLIRKAKHLLPRSYFPVRVLLRENNRSGAEMPSKERFMDLWKKELEQCNHILNDEYFHPKYYPMLTGPQLSSACAVVGARVAQEAIKVLSHRDEPLQNVFFYSALDSSGILCRLPPDI